MRSCNSEFASVFFSSYSLRLISERLRMDFLVSIPSSISLMRLSLARRLPAISRFEPPVIEPEVEITSPSKVTILNARGYLLAICVAFCILSTISVLPSRLCITFSNFLSKRTKSIAKPIAPRSRTADLICSFSVLGLKASIGRKVT